MLLQPISTGVRLQNLLEKQVGGQQLASVDMDVNMGYWAWKLTPTSVGAILSIMTCTVRRWLSTLFLSDVERSGMCRVSKARGEASADSQSDIISNDDASECKRKRRQLPAIAIQSLKRVIHNTWMPFNA
jgi:hypothetical protein